MVEGPTLNEERLTWAQVCQRYPNQWVVRVDMDWVDDMYSEIRTAIVAGHGGDDESFEQAEPYRTRFLDVAHLHTRPPDSLPDFAVEPSPCRSPA